MECLSCWMVTPLYPKLKAFILADQFPARPGVGYAVEVWVWEVTIWWSCPGWWIGCNLPHCFITGWAWSISSNKSDSIRWVASSERRCRWWEAFQGLVPCISCLSPLVVSALGVSSETSAVALLLICLIYNLGAGTEDRIGWSDPGYPMVLNVHLEMVKTCMYNIVLEIWKHTESINNQFIGLYNIRCFTPYSVHKRHEKLLIKILTPHGVLI